MKIITYSDLHMEFGSIIKPPEDSFADLMILAGDLINFRNYKPLDLFLERWKRPVIFVAGNHEYYTNTNMHTEAARFQDWLSNNHPNVHFLQDRSITIDGVHFFGGTMWTDFLGGSEQAMHQAQAQMNDFRLIKMEDGVSLTPQYTTKLHSQFVEKLLQWFKQSLSGKRIVVTHHAPVIKPMTKYIGSLLSPAFNSTDMIEIITQYQPDLWIYGHTHECDDHYFEKTRIISNQSGYPSYVQKYKCGKDFDPSGKPLNIG